MSRKTTVTRRVAGALVVLAALPGLAACSPPDRPLTAVRAVDGKPVMLIVTCADYEIDTITLYTTSRDPSVLTGGPDWKVHRTGTEVPGVLPLLSKPPTGWEVLDDKLTELVADQPYGLAAYAFGKGTVNITFTEADLAALGAGEVLVGKLPAGHEKVTEKEFTKRAKKSC